MASPPAPSSAASAANPLPAPDVERYSRQLLLPCFGPAAQQRLRSSRALIVGVGGLGCPAALYLAGAGVGTLGLVDRPHEAVEKSNLHRQIAHTTAGAARAALKVDSARAAIAAHNPGVEVATHAEFTAANAVALAASYDLVLDCTDNVAARYLVSDACAASRTALVSGAAIGLDGQLTVYCAADIGAPCYRCVFPAPPPPSCVGSCDSAGVLGPVPGTIGTLMALEAIKVLGKIRNATSLAGRLLLFDGASMEFRTVKLRGRDRSCVACGDERNLDVASFDYEAFAKGGATVKEVLQDEFRISVQDLERMREKRGREDTDFLLLDVRPENQFAVCSLGESRNVPLSKLDEETVAGLEKLHTPIVVLCRRGNKSQTACVKLHGMGVTDAVDVRGGLQAWHHEIDKDFPLY